MSKVRWGFQWGKVFSGALMLLIGAGFAMLALYANRVLIWPIGLAAIGVFVLASGLMGEDGVW